MTIEQLTSDLLALEKMSDSELTDHLSQYFTHTRPSGKKVSDGQSEMKLSDSGGPRPRTVAQKSLAIDDKLMRIIKRSGLSVEEFTKNLQ